MRKVSLILGLVFMVCLGIRPAAVFAQESVAAEPGILEHLDTVVPAGLSFTNENGQAVDFRSLVNKPTILTLVYYDCMGICPTLLAGVSDAIEKMGMELGKDFDVITVSFNTDDTPEKSLDKKKNFLREHSRPHAASWNYLTGDSAAIYGLTNTVGFLFERTGNDFMHPACIIVLSPQGKVTRYLYGTSFVPFDIKMAIIEAQKGQSRPTINRVLEYCFSYDPEGRKYTLQVTKISATVILFFAGLLFIVLVIRSSRKKSKPQNS